MRLKHYHTKSAIRASISFLRSLKPGNIISNASNTGVNDRLILVHQKSPYASLPLEIFIREFKNIESGQLSEIDFNESFYRAAHQDVVKNIEKGIFSSGFEHFCLHGASEKRIWSNQKINVVTGEHPRYPSGDLAPIYMYERVAYPARVQWANDHKKRMVVLFDNLQKAYFYAGYTGFFKDFSSIFGLFDEVVFSVENPYFESDLVTSQIPNGNVIHASALCSVPEPSLIITFSNITTNKAFEIYKAPEKTIYYCQEFEAGFLPLSTRYIDAEKAIIQAKNIIISTRILHQYLKDKNLISSANILITSPEIHAFEISKDKNKRIFMYFRPEAFHQRNLPEIIWQAAMQFCDTHTGFELYLCGTVDTCFSFERNNNHVYVLSKLPNDQYISIISSCDVVVSLIYAPHPGVIAFQGAASGIPSITNIYSNRDANTLRNISENIVPYNPHADSLKDLIEKALLQKKGNASFNAELYGTPVTHSSLHEYVHEIVKKSEIV